MLIDCGANVECTSEYLLQFAFMGSFYSKHILGVSSPKVGLLNNGTEDSKGCKTSPTPSQKRGTREGSTSLATSRVRPRLAGEVDVIVTDGLRATSCSRAARA